MVQRIARWMAAYYVGTGPTYSLVVSVLLNADVTMLAVVVVVVVVVVVAPLF